eukprot:216348-Rhodomonas_salina.1
MTTCSQFTRKRDAHTYRNAGSPTPQTSADTHARSPTTQTPGSLALKHTSTTHSLRSRDKKAAIIARELHTRESGDLEFADACDAGPESAADMVALDASDRVSVVEEENALFLKVDQYSDAVRDPDLRALAFHRDAKRLPTHDAGPQ